MSAKYKVSDSLIGLGTQRDGAVRYAREGQLVSAEDFADAKIPQHLVETGAIKRDQTAK